MAVLIPAPEPDGVSPSSPGPYTTYVDATGTGSADTASHAHDAPLSAFWSGRLSSAARPRAVTVRFSGMASEASPRFGLLLASLAAFAASVVAAVTVSAWALCVLPPAVIAGVCAWNGLTLRQTWAAMDGSPEEDGGRGFPGMTF